MPKRSSKKSNLSRSTKKAVKVVAQAPSESSTVALATGGDIAVEKNPAAVALGHLGGIKGGRARAEKLSAKKRSQIAKKAAEARWSQVSNVKDNYGSR